MFRRLAGCVRLTATLRMQFRSHHNRQSFYLHTFCEKGQRSAKSEPQTRGLPLSGPDLCLKEETVSPHISLSPFSIPFSILAFSPPCSSPLLTCHSNSRGAEDYDKSMIYRFLSALHTTVPDDPKERSRKQGLPLRTRFANRIGKQSLRRSGRTANHKSGTRPALCTRKGSGYTYKYGHESLFASAFFSFHLLLSSARDSPQSFAPSKLSSNVCLYSA